jgi:hypothetical protein
VVIADADLLNPELWSAGDGGAARWREGNVDWIIAMIDELAGSRPGALAAPVWKRVPRDRGESASSGDKPQEQGGNLAVAR